MAKSEQPVTSLVGDEGHIVHATWSRAGRNLILTVARDGNWSEYTQVVLSQEQAADLGDFLNEGPDGR